MNTFKNQLSDEVTLYDMISCLAQNPDLTLNVRNGKMTIYLHDTTYAVFNLQIADAEDIRKALEKTLDVLLDSQSED